MSDELLLDKVNVACANETEHQNKKKLLSHQHPTKVNPVQVNEVAVEKKAKTQCHKNTEKLEPDVRVTIYIYIYIYIAQQRLAHWIVDAITLAYQSQGEPCPLGMLSPMRWCTAPL